MLLLATALLLLTKACHYPVSAMRDAYLANAFALFTAHDSSAIRSNRDGYGALPCYRSLVQSILDLFNALYR